MADVGISWYQPSFCYAKKQTSYREIATPVCGLARNDISGTLFPGCQKLPANKTKDYAFLLLKSRKKRL